MTISEMRSYIMNRYPDSMKWHNKVRKMKTQQVVAIYYSMLNREKKKNENKIKENKNEEQYHQIDMFEYLASITENHTDIKIKG